PCTVSPANATNRAVTWSSGNQSVATVDDNGLVTAVAEGTATITVTSAANNNFKATCTVTVEKVSQAVVDAEISYSYAGNECAAFEWGDSNAANATVQYKLKSASSYTTLSGNDKQYLVRQKNSTTARVDFVGLKGGETYDFKITTSANKVLTASDVTVHSYDRSGYAHFGKSDGVGAYKDDGTPKSNAVIVYVNEANKNTVKATVNGKERTGIVEILQNAGTSTPLIVRIVGTVGAATWKKNNVTYTKTSGNTDSSNNLLPSAITDKNGVSLVTAYDVTTGIKDKKYNQDITQKTLLDDNRNVLDTSIYAELKNLTSKIKWDAEKQEFDSCWNDCPISGVKNVTVEGIGEDAEIFQWGMTFKNSSSIEVRNLHFDDYTEDACSFEGSESGATELSAFKSGNVWVHHNTFDEGNNYWDVCKEQDKHDGDGSTDFKGIKNITIAYNHYISTHKTNLIGGGDGHATANVTFHHNYYQSCNQRMPLGRQANMHMYNNYYSGSTLYSISLRAGAYAFIENCYFTEDASNHYPVELVTGSYGKPSAKIINCVIDKNKVNSHNKSGDAYLYIGSDRSATVNTTDQRFAKNFDTDSNLFYYKDGKSDVSVMFTAEETKTYVPKLAGVQKHGGDVTLGGSGSGSTGTGTGTETPEPTPGTGDLIKCDPSTLTSGALAAGSTQTFGGLTLHGSGKLSVIEGKNTVSYNGKSYTSTKYISLGGGANFDGNEACVEFTATKNCKVTIATRSSGTERTLKVVGGAEDLTIAAPDKGAAIAVTSVNLGAGTYKIGSSSGGINIFYIIIEYTE
ncbi:MAG: Ig-like domain-containing protein, partial [Clostridia bacterium]|nr:Ig-like domain-containing protein [Clostridia bacterium]